MNINMKILLKYVILAGVLIGTIVKQDIMMAEAAAPETCHLELVDKDVTLTKIQDYLTRAKLIEYKLTLPSTGEGEQDYNITTNGTANYKIDEWKRVFSRHGQALLSVPFNYKMLSLSLLSFGVVEVDVELQDNPSGCFSNFTGKEKISTIRDLVMYDFQLPDNGTKKYLKEGNFACHQVIRSKDNMAKFVYECCTITQTTRSVQCDDHVKNRWFILLFSAVPWMDVVFFLFFPLFALGVISRRSYRTTNYIVKLKEPHIATIKKDIKNIELKDIHKKPSKTLLEKIPILGKEKNKKTAITNSVAKKRLCVDHVRKLPWNRPIKVELPLLHILVDHKQLMAENDVNIGLLQFIWRNIFLCGLRFDYPFITCCKQSFIFGNWKRKFFCCLIPQHRLVKTMRQLNRRVRKYLSWKNVFGLLCFISIIVILIPLPYYIEIIVFRKFSETEINDRITASNALGLSINPPVYEPQTYFVPFMPLHVAALVVYFVTSVIFLFIYQYDTFNLIEYLVSILRDFKHLERIETFRMLAVQLVTPFEKFGLLGLVVGPLMWLITLPFGIVTIVYYCIPTIYLLGRLLFPEKPTIVKWLMCYKKTHSDRYTASLKEEKKLKKKIRRNDEDDSDDDDDPHLDSLEKMLLLQRISPKNDDFLPIRPLRKDGTLKAISIVGYTDLQKRLLGVILTLWMIGLLVLYSDFFGFTIEILILTFMGAIANASSVGQYFFFAFFVVTYTRTVLNKVNEKYQKMSSELFSHIKTKLDEDLSETVILRGTEQKNFAFKFFSKEELRELNVKRQLSIASDVEDDFADIYKDKFETTNKRLHLNLHTVILFLDKFDKPRIPKRLFDQVCQIKCPGCPGPIYKSLLLALKELAYLIVFLFFVLLVVMAFGDVYEISTTNKLLLTVVGGFAPFVVRFVMKPKSLHVNFSTYSFKGKVHEIITSYRQSWPVYDIEFDLNEAICNEILPDDNADIDEEKEGLVPEIGATNIDSSEHKQTDSTVIEVREDDIVVVEDKPSMSRPTPHEEMHSSPNTPTVNESNPTKASLYKLEIMDGEIDLVFHMRNIRDDEEEQDPFVLTNKC